MFDQDILRRKLNPFLLVTTVMVLALLAGASVIYQQELGDLVGSKNNLSTQLDNKEVELKEVRNEVERLEKKRNNLNSKISRLKDRIINITESKDEEISGLESEIDSLETEVNDWKEKYREENQSRYNIQQNYNEMRLDFEIVCSETNKTFDSCEERFD